MTQDFDEDRDDRDDEDRYETREEYGREPDCRECDTYGPIQCSRHGDAVLDEQRRLSLDWEQVHGARSAQVGRRHGLPFSDEEVQRLGQARLALHAETDPLAERLLGRSSCLRCRFGLNCGCDIPF